MSTIKYINARARKISREKASYARQALAAYRDIIGDHDHDDHDFTAIGDLLADLQHHTYAQGLNWDDLLDRADMHYQAEIRGED